MLIRNQASNPSGKAFTLIELLIVVAIIAILAAIAVPNFLEAQVRSKVARVKSDLRTLDTALEAYGVDYNRYPTTTNFFSPLPSQRLIGLTSPVAYISSIPSDPFERRNGGNFEATIRQIDPNESLDQYLYNTGNNDVALGTNGRSLLRQYSLASGGPDLTVDFPYYAFSRDFIDQGIYLGYIYDPTNGTVSRGEIFRRGGYQPDYVPGLQN